MKYQLFSKIKTALKTTEETYNIQLNVKNTIMIAPIIIILLHGVFWLHPTIRILSDWMLMENHPVELLTFVVLIVSGVLSFKLALKTKRWGRKKLIYLFYIIFSMGLIFVAMEEIAWGQWFFGFETPESWKAINDQGETTIHNLRGFQGNTEILRLTYGICGLLGVGFSFTTSLQKIGVPVILMPWLLIIVAQASVDLYNDYVAIQEQFDIFIGRTSELIELFIAINALLYVQLNMRMLSVKRN